MNDHQNAASETSNSQAGTVPGMVPAAREAHGLQSGWSSGIRPVNGLSVHVVEAGPQDGPLLILLHGFPEFWWAWRKQIAPLAEAGFHVLVPDMRGYNRSDAPQEIAAYHLDILVADVVALARTAGAHRFSLVGHDWGGIVAWETAVRHPGLLERLVIMNAPHPDLFPAQLLRHPTQALRSSYAALFQLPWLPEAMLKAFGFAALRRTMKSSAREDVFTGEVLDRYAQAWARPGRLSAMLNYYRALRRRKRRRPARIEPPTLLLWGKRDRFLEPHLAQASLTLCERGRLTILEEATHWLHHEEPSQVTAEIAGFLGDGVARRGAISVRPAKDVVGGPVQGGAG